MTVAGPSNSAARRLSNAAAGDEHKAYTLPDLVVYSSSIKISSARLVELGGAAVARLSVVKLRRSAQASARAVCSATSELNSLMIRSYLHNFAQIAQIIGSKMVGRDHQELRERALRLQRVLPALPG